MVIVNYIVVKNGKFLDYISIFIFIVIFDIILFKKELYYV